MFIVCVKGKSDEGERSVRVVAELVLFAVALADYHMAHGNQQ